MASDKVDPDMNPPDVSPEELPPDVPRARNVLLDILERNRAQIEDESARLMDDIKARDDDERLRREEEERQKAAELRTRVDEERRRREEAEQAYEDRKARKAIEAEAKARPVATVVGAALPVPEKKRGLGLFIGLVVILLAGGGVAGYLLMPQASLPTMDLERPLDTARPGSVVATPLPYGPTAIADAGRVPAPEVLVARIAVQKYEPPAPEPVAPKARRRSAPSKPKPLIDIQEGILGGRKVIR